MGRALEGVGLPLAMRSSLLLPLLLVPPGFVLVAACGGSASETPWPVEPENTVMNPAGETAPVGGPIDDSPASRGEVPAVTTSSVDAGKPPPRNNPR
jgi:hypothetical protein